MTGSTHDRCFWRQDINNALPPGCNCTYATPAPDTLNGTCVQSYVNHWTTEHASTGAANNHVCLFTEAKDFEWMVRVSSHPVALPVQSAVRVLDSNVSSRPFALPGCLALGP